MNRRFLIQIFFVLAIMICYSANAQNKILVVTGGKSFESESFYEIFNSFNDVEFDTISKPSAFSVFTSDKINEYDAIVFYDTYQPISEDEKKSFLNLLEAIIWYIKP